VRFAYLVSVWLHIVAAIVWLGAMTFLALVLVPTLRARGDRHLSAELMRGAGPRLRALGWTALGVLAATGILNLGLRGFELASLTDGGLWHGPFGRAFALKMIVVLAVVVLSLVHDFWVGPRAGRAAARDPWSEESARLRTAASWLGRANLILALVIVMLAVMLVRGWPF